MNAGDVVERKDTGARGTVIYIAINPTHIGNVALLDMGDGHQIWIATSLLLTLDR